MSTHSVRPHERSTNSEALSAAGRKGSAKRHSPDAYIRSLVRRAPELTEDNKAALRALLASVDGGARSDA